MRVPVTGSEPPTWPRVLLARLGEYVFSSARPPAAGHRLQPGGQITGGNPDSRLTAVAFDLDPQLGVIDTPNGVVKFLTVVGVTEDELHLMQESTTATVLSDLAANNATLVTDPLR